MDRTKQAILQLFASVKATLRLNTKETPEEKTIEKVIQTEKAPEPVGSYSQGIKVGKFPFVSGQVAID